MAKKSQPRNCMETLEEALNDAKLIQNYSGGHSCLLSYNSELLEVPYSPNQVGTFFLQQTGSSPHLLFPPKHSKSMVFPTLQKVAKHWKYRWSGPFFVRQTTQKACFWLHKNIFDQKGIFFIGNIKKIITD